VRLRYAYFVTCRKVVTNAAGEIVELRCTYDPATRGGNAPDGRRAGATLHWVAASHARPAEIRLLSPLFTRPDPGVEGDVFADLDANSLEVLEGALVEPALAEVAPGEVVQFERQGYFCRDPDGVPAHPVFNRTVGLRDSWAKTQAEVGAPSQPSPRFAGSPCGGRVRG
jgi:glutaminyl-tRNA synthetase